jgi:hypothetical protein
MTIIHRFAIVYCDVLDEIERAVSGYYEESRWQSDTVSQLLLCVEAHDRDDELWYCAGTGYNRIQLRMVGVNTALFTGLRYDSWAGERIMQHGRQMGRRAVACRRLKEVAL